MTETAKRDPKDNAPAAKVAPGPGSGKGQGQAKGPDRGQGRPARPAPKPAPEVNIRPVAQPASLRRRHWGLMVTFLILVLAPLIGLAYYLWTVAEDQYSSTTGFTVRSEETGGASEMLGGLAQLAGTSTASDSDILYEFIQSQEIVAAIDARVDLRTHYSAVWPKDVLFGLWPDATIEDLVWFWQRVVRISYDQSTGLIEVRVLAFDPDAAQDIAREILRESQSMINALNIQAREDAMRYARIDLDESVERLKAAREALTAFRTRTQIVDPQTDIQGRMGVLANLQQQLAEALIEYDLLRDTVPGSDPRLTTAQREIDVIRSRIASERRNFATAGTERDHLEEDYPSLITEYESLSVDREFAEETYRAALTALELARDNAARQSRYLASYIQPTMAGSSEFPRRGMLLGLAALVLLLSWSILALVYYSIRDRG